LREQEFTAAICTCHWPKLAADIGAEFDHDIPRSTLHSWMEELDID